jgi:hypothetical protein
MNIKYCRCVFIPIIIIEHISINKFGYHSRIFVQMSGIYLVCTLSVLKRLKGVTIPRGVYVNFVIVSYVY